MIKRLLNKEQRKIIKNIKKFKQKQFKSFSVKEKDDLLKILAEKAGLINIEE